MADIIKEILEETGGSLSSDIAKILTEQYGLSAATARKRIERRSADIGSLGYLKFARNTRFMYLKRDFGSIGYWLRLIEVMLQSNSAYGLALAALMQRGGLIPERHFPIACGSPIKQKKHLSSDTVYTNLQQAGLVNKVEVPGVGTCVALIQGSNQYEGNATYIRARLITESILLNAVRDWIKKLGFGSYEKVKTRDDSNILPQIGTFAWDLTAPSFVGPMVEWQADGKPKGGYIACDILHFGLVTPQGLAPFIHKCTTLRSLEKVGRTLQVFVAQRYSKQAFVLAKQKGILAATPETLFGKEVAEGIAALTEVLITAAKTSVDPEVFNELFERLSKIEGATSNLRGAFFEYLVAEVIRADIPDVTVNKILKNEDGTSIEIDVLAVEKHKTVTFIECKGYSPLAAVPDHEVENWLIKKIPFAERYARQVHPEWRNLTLQFEFWTTGKLSPEVIKMINSLKNQVRHNKYTIDYLDADAVNKRARDSRNKPLMKTLEKHYFEDPIRIAERAVKSRGNESSKKNMLLEFVPDEDSLNSVTDSQFEDLDFPVLRSLPAPPDDSPNNLIKES